MCENQQYQEASVVLNFSEIAEDYERLIVSILMLG